MIQCSYMRNTNRQSKQYRHLETGIAIWIFGGLNSVNPVELTKDAHV